MHLFPIEVSHPLVELWPDSLLNGVLWLLRFNRFQFQTVEVFRIGKDIHNAQPTILITTLYLNQPSGAMVKGAIQIFCSAKKANLQVVIDEVIISITRNKSRVTATGGHHERAYTKPVPMGQSIGRAPIGAGTLAGYLELRDKTGTTALFGLTNHHVIRDNEKNWPACKFDNYSTNFAHTVTTLDNETHEWPRGRGIVQSPSESDHAAEIQQLEARLKKAKSEFELSPVKLKVEYGCPTKAQQTGYDLFVDDIRILQERLALCQSIDKNGLYFGWVQFSSGFRRIDNHALDWALIRVDRERLVDNSLPEPSDVTPYKLKGQTHVDDFVDWEMTTKKFCKIGRTTGITLGHYSHIEAHVELKLPLNSEIERGSLRITSEHVVVSSENDKLFSGDGDSGAWLLSEGGYVVGLIWGAGPRGQTYFTPISPVIKDIEEATGLTVGLRK